MSTQTDKEDFCMDYIVRHGSTVKKAEEVWEAIKDRYPPKKVDRDALERGKEMMLIPMSKLPPLAVEFAEKLIKEVGMCMEVLLTAWCCYAQCVEGMSCSDDLYKARDVDRAWFKSKETT